MAGHASRHVHDHHGARSPGSADGGTGSTRRRWTYSAVLDAPQP